MKRALLNLPMLASLLLCAALAAMWVRSYWREDIVGVNLESGTRGAVSRGGALGVDWWINTGLNDAALHDPYHRVFPRSPGGADFRYSTLPRIVELRPPNVRPPSRP